MSMFLISKALNESPAVILCQLFVDESQMYFPLNNVGNLFKFSALIERMFTVFFFDS